MFGNLMIADIFTRVLVHVHFILRDSTLFMYPSCGTMIPSIFISSHWSFNVSTYDSIHHSLSQQFACVS